LGPNHVCLKREQAIVKKNKPKEKEKYKAQDKKSFFEQSKIKNLA
jgi:hypothetical protein